MTGIGQAHYMLTAEPADNPNQPPADQQGDHHPGAHREVERIRKLLKAPEPLMQLEQLAQLAYGDVVFDYSQVPQSDAFNAQLKAAKCVAVSRYYSPLNADGSDYGPTFVKVIQVPEYQWHLANGRWVFKNYEWYETRMDEGAAAGKQDAYWAGTRGWRLDQAVGIDPLNPANEWARWITFSNDKDGTPYAVVKAYLLAAYAQLQSMPGKYLPNYYGRQAIWEQLLKDPDIHWLPWGWQTCAWSGGVYGGDAGMYQALCAPVTPNIAGCDTNFIMKTLFTGNAVQTTEEAMIIVHAPTAGIGALGPYGIYHYNGLEWATVVAVRNAIPAAIRDTLMPYIAITDAQWHAMAPDGLQRSLLMILRGDTDANGQPLPEGQNTHPDNITFISRHVNDVKKATDTVEPMLTSISSSVLGLPTKQAVTDAATAGVEAVLPTVDQAIKDAVNAAVAAAAPDLPGVVKDSITTAVGANLSALKLNVTLAGNANTVPVTPPTS